MMIFFYWHKVILAWFRRCYHSATKDSATIPGWCLSLTSATGLPASAIGQPGDTSGWQNLGFGPAEQNKRCQSTFRPWPGQCQKFFFWFDKVFHTAADREHSSRQRWLGIWGCRPGFLDFQNMNDLLHCVQTRSHCIIPQVAPVVEQAPPSRVGVSTRSMRSQPDLSLPSPSLWDRSREHCPTCLREMLSSELAAHIVRFHWFYSWLKIYL